MSLLFISDIWTTCDTEKQNIYCIALLLHDLFAENQSAGDCFFNNEMLTAWQRNIRSHLKWVVQWVTVPAHWWKWNIMQQNELHLLLTQVQHSFLRKPMPADCFVWGGFIFFSLKRLRNVRAKQCKSNFYCVMFLHVINEKQCCLCIAFDMFSLVYRAKLMHRLTWVIVKAPGERGPSN